MSAPTPLSADELRAEVERLTDELAGAQDVLGQWEATYGRDELPGGMERLRRAELEAEELAGRVEELRAENDSLQQRLHRAAMTRVWRNEDGKKFVFVEDIAPALLGTEDNR